MTKFEKFRKNILGKIYHKKYENNKIYVIVDVCGRRDSSMTDSEVLAADVIYISVLVPNKNAMTSYYSDNEFILIGANYISLGAERVLNELKSQYTLTNEYTLDDVVNCYKTANANFKELLRNIGADI